MESLVFNIQKYSIHDGEGIRTTVFFKGCPMVCKWCHNPESQRYKAEVSYNDEKCTQCLSCISKCNEGAIKPCNDKVSTNRSTCTLCETCMDYCINNAREKVGKYYNIDNLMNEIEKDKMFYEESGGGVTLSGGEVMTQDMSYILQILKKCKRLGYSVNIDTCGHAPLENFEKVLPYVDTFLYDIKHMEDDIHKELTGQSNELVLSNLIFLSEKNAKLNIRMPLVAGINDSDEHMDKVIDFLKSISVTQINLLPYHNTGKSKYKNIDMIYPGDDYAPPSQERLEALKERFRKNNLNAKIGG